MALTGRTSRSRCRGHARRSKSSNGRTAWRNELLEKTYRQNDVNARTNKPVPTPPDSDSADGGRWRREGARAMSRASVASPLLLLPVRKAAVQKHEAAIAHHGAALATMQGASAAQGDQRGAGKAACEPAMAAMQGRRTSGPYASPACEPAMAATQGHRTSGPYASPCDTPTPRYAS